MAVVAVWKCDRDGSMFDDKKAADAHDKMLELAINITRLVEDEVPGVNDTDAEAIGMLLARRKDDLIKACKGKPEVLLAGDGDELKDESQQDGTQEGGSQEDGSQEDGSQEDGSQEKSPANNLTAVN